MVRRARAASEAISSNRLVWDGSREEEEEEGPELDSASEEDVAGGEERFRRKEGR